MAHTVRTADNRILRRKLLSTLVKFQKSPKRDLSSNKQPLRGSSGKYVSASEKARKQQKGIIAESKPINRKVESDDEDSDFECYDKSVNVNVDKEVTGSSGKEPTLVLLPNKSEEKVNKNVETRVGNDSRDGNTSLQRFYRSFKPPERLGSIPYF